MEESLIKSYVDVLRKICLEHIPADAAYKLAVTILTRNGVAIFNRLPIAVIAQCSEDTYDYDMYFDNIVIKINVSTWSNNKYIVNIDVKPLCRLADKERVKVLITE